VQWEALLWEARQQGFLDALTFDGGASTASLLGSGLQSEVHWMDTSRTER